MVDDRNAELSLGPAECVWIASLPREEQRSELAEIVFGDQCSLGVLLADGAERGRGREHAHDAMFGDHSPEGAGVGCSDRFALVEHRRAAMEERGIHDV